MDETDERKFKSIHDPDYHGPGFSRYKQKLGAEKAEALRQDTLRQQREALDWVREKKGEVGSALPDFKPIGEGKDIYPAPRTKKSRSEEMIEQERILHLNLLLYEIIGCYPKEDEIIDKNLQEMKETIETIQELRKSKAAPVLDMEVKDMRYAVMAKEYLYNAAWWNRCAKLSDGQWLEKQKDLTPKELELLQTQIDKQLEKWKQKLLDEGVIEG